MSNKNICIFKMIKILLFVYMFCVINACDSESDSKEQYPSLKVVNQRSSRIIKSVELVNYEFNSLSIATGNSQIFALDNGMPGGYQDINITVMYGSGTANWFISNQYDFKDGETTIVTLTDSSLE